MAKHHTPEERFSLYQSGWRAGAASRLRNKQRADDTDYESGYGDGRHAYTEAMKLMQWSYQASPPSILREGSAHMQGLG